MSQHQNYGDADVETMDQPEDDDAYEVGFGKPPKDTRFKPGQSGNPSGRPKKQKSQQEIFLELLQDRITIVENGQRKQVSKFEAVCRTTLNSALKGDQRAAKKIFDFMDKVELEAPKKSEITQIEWIIVDHRSATPAENSA